MGQAATTVDEAPLPSAPASLCTNLCWLLGQASHAVSTATTAALEGLGVSPRAQSVLTAALNGEHTQIELARLVGLDKTTMVVTLDELERAGLAERRPSATDRRARVVAVTEAGERMVREAEEIIERVRADVLGTLAPEEREVFVSALTRLVSERLVAPVQCANPPRRSRSR